MTREEISGDSGGGELEKLRQIAYRDYLTGIPNRRFFMEELSSRIFNLSGSGQFILVGIIDLNGFKAINDLHGHKIGDRLLVEVASRLIGLMDPGDLMARLGGDEFAFVLSHFDRISGVRDRIEEILTELTRPIHIEGVEEGVTVSGSIGATLYPDDDSDPKTLLHHADQALYEVKKRKQAAWSFYLAESFPQGSDPEESNKFREVINLDSAEFLYQPEYDLFQGSVCGAAAFIRWRKGGRRWRKEQSVTEESRHPVVLRVGERIVLHRTMEALRRWTGRERDFLLYVGFGSHNIKSQINTEDLIPMLMEFQDVVDRLVIQVDQTVAHHYFDKIRGFFSEVHRFGAHAAIDDFGFGGLFLPSLMKLEPDRIVLSSSLVSNMTEDPRNLGLVANIFLTGATSGMQVIATGVERASHLRILRKLGCTRARGNFLGCPLPELEFQTRSVERMVVEPLSGQGNPLSSDQILLLFVQEEPYSWIEAHQRLFYSEAPTLPEDALLLAENRSQCGLGRWLSGPGRKRFENYEEFREIAILHNRFHDFVDSLLITCRSLRWGERLNDVQREDVRTELENIARNVGTVARRLEGRIAEAK